MFTGIIEALCDVRSCAAAAGGRKLGVDLGRLAEGVRFGDSIAINGICQTVVDIKSSHVSFDVSGETVKKTTVSSFTPGQKVNVERAMKTDGRFGGHIVQGHVDGIGKVKSIKMAGGAGGFNEVSFTVPAEIAEYVIAKGSIAIDGVSLTIAEIMGSDFSVSIIPATWENTVFKNYKVGDKVNIETDIICRVIKSQLEKMLSASGGLTVDKLKSLGF